MMNQRIWGCAVVAMACAMSWSLACAQMVPPPTQPGAAPGSIGALPPGAANLPPPSVMPSAPAGAPMAGAVPLPSGGPSGMPPMPSAARPGMGPMPGAPGQGMPSMPSAAMQGMPPMPGGGMPPMPGVGAPMPGGTPMPYRMPGNAMMPGNAVPLQQPAMAGVPAGRPMPPMGPAPDQIDNWIAFAKDQIKITEDQLPQWTAFADVVRANSRKFADSRGGKGSMMVPVAAAVPDRLDQMEQSLSLQLELVRATKAVLPPLYAVLSDEQKKAADNFIRGPLGML